MWVGGGGHRELKLFECVIEFIELHSLVTRQWSLAEGRGVGPQSGQC